MTTSRLPRPARQPAPRGTTSRRVGRPVAVLAAAALSLALAGCSDDSTAEDPSVDPASSEPGTSEASPTEPSPTESESADPEEPAPSEPVAVPASGSAGAEQAWVVGMTQAGGRVETLATPLDSEQAVADFAAQLEGDVTDQLQQAVDAAGAADTMTWGTVAAIGCDAPESVTVEAGEAGFEVTPELPADRKQCVAPVTYVVVFNA